MGPPEALARVTRIPRGHSSHVDLEFFSAGAQNLLHLTGDGMMCHIDGTLDGTISLRIKDRPIDQVLYLITRLAGAVPRIERSHDRKSCTIHLPPGGALPPAELPLEDGCAEYGGPLHCLPNSRLELAALAGAGKHRMALLRGTRVDGGPPLYSIVSLGDAVGSAALVIRKIGSGAVEFADGSTIQLRN